jgi:multiple sugar transport system permease protein
MNRLRTNYRGLLFISPWLTGFVLLIAYPFAASLYWSFTQYDMIDAPRAVGLANYETLAEELSSGRGFGLAVWNTLYYAAISVPLSIALGIGLAVMLSWQVRGQAVFRTLFYLPSVVPAVAAAALWLWLLDPQSGLVNHLLTYVGVEQGPGWFKSVGEGFVFRGGFGSKDGLILMSLWGVGNFMLIYLAALGDIPQQLYEAAELDGAGRIRRFWHITLPMLSPVIFFNLVLGIIQAVQAFTQVYIVSEGQGGPAGSTMMISMHLFLSAFRDQRMGYASAVAWLLFAAILAVTVLLFRTSKYWVHYQGLPKS